MSDIETTYLRSKRPFREWAAYQNLKTLPPNTLCLSGIWYPEGLIAALAGVKRHIILAHGAELFLPKQSWRKPLWRFLRRYVLESADLIIANSSYTASLVQECAPLAQVEAIPLGVDPIFFAPQIRTEARTFWSIPEDKHVICSVSRLHAFKGHDTILDAIAALPQQKRSQILYLIAGIGPALSALKDQAQQLGITEQIRWLGFVPDKDLPTLYSAADLFVLATREIPEQRSVEGFGLVFLEAQACGTPVVGTRSGGIPDAIVENQGGWLIEENDTQTLQSILIQLLDNPEAFTRMGAIARKRIEGECTWDQYINHLEESLCRHTTLENTTIYRRSE